MLIISGVRQRVVDLTKFAKIAKSRKSYMTLYDLFGTRLGTQRLWVVGFIGLFDEVRAELVRDISRTLRFL